jgi:hypothetical protein
VIRTILNAMQIFTQAIDGDRDVAEFLGSQTLKESHNARYAEN